MKLYSASRKFCTVVDKLRRDNLFKVKLKLHVLVLQENFLVFLTAFNTSSRISQGQSFRHIPRVNESNI